MPISITFVSFARTESALHNSVFTYTTCNVLGLCKRLVRCILLIWLTSVWSRFQNPSIRPKKMHFPGYLISGRTQSNLHNNVYHSSVAVVAAPTACLHSIAYENWS